MKQPIVPIPTPWQVKAEEFRTRYLPVAVCGVVAVAAMFIWRHQVNEFVLSGVGEGSRSLVASPQSGMIQHLYVKPYQRVKRGDPIAVILPTDPRMQLEVLRAEMQVAQLRSQPTLAEEHSLDYERVRSELLRSKTALVLAKVNLERTEKDLKRNTPLYQEKLVSEEMYDLSLKTRDAYQAEVEETTKIIDEIENRMARLRGLGDPDSPVANQKLDALGGRLERASLAAATNLAPITLVAPMAGMVSGLGRRQGEFIVDGEPMLTIQSMASERIVGYLRQPYTVDAQVGMQVQVTTRAGRRQTFLTEIAEVGAQTEAITNALAFFRQGELMDFGLPIVVSVPKGIEIRPGELVGIVFKHGVREAVGGTDQTRRDRLAKRSPTSL